MMNLTLIGKTYREHWKSLVAWSSVIIFMVSIQMSIYPSFKKSGEAASQFLDSYPDAFKKIFRMDDYLSGSGFLGTELFSLMLPLVMIGIGVTWGANATAGEEDEGTADLLFTLPFSRAKILLSKSAALVSALCILAVITFLNVVLLRDITKLEIGAINLIWACIQQLALGMTFGAIALVLGSLTGRKGFTLGVSSGIGIVMFLFFSLTPLVDTFSFLTPINPFDWTIGTNILAEGPNYWGLLKLCISSVALYFLALMLLNKREIRS